MKAQDDHNPLEEPAFKLPPRNQNDARCPSNSSSPEWIPQLAFGLYKVDSVATIHDAMNAGYRHFDAASVYGNHKQLGQALRTSGLPRSALFITSKIWNDSVRARRVRQEVLNSLTDVGCEYFDLFLVHWPVPGHFVEAYQQLQALHQEGKLRALGLSNFTPSDYTELMDSKGITLPPVVNQIECSPFMYRPDYIHFFQERGVFVMAHKALDRASIRMETELTALASHHGVTPAQIMIRWGMQHNLIVTTKTNRKERMVQNRTLTFELSTEDMRYLDGLTKPVDVEQRRKLEIERKLS